MISNAGQKGVSSLSWCFFSKPVKMFHFDFLHYIESVNIQIVNQRSKQNISLSNTKIHGHMRRKLSSDSSTQSIWGLCKVQGRLTTCSILFLGRIPSSQSNILFNENVFDVILPSQEKSFADFLIKRLFWETTQIDRSVPIDQTQQNAC